ISQSRLEGKIVVLNKAISGCRGKTDFFVYANNPNANSTDPQNMVELDDRKETMKVDQTTIEDILEMFNEEPIHLLKMDCEGCEYQSLGSLPSASFSRIQKIILEYHNGIQNLSNILQNNGYAVKINSALDNKMGYLTGEKEN
ncbi:MAG: FkbM family methyltransferase, partial [Candidatus Parvarchaeota archaeon]